MSVATVVLGRSWKEGNPTITVVTFKMSCSMYVVRGVVSSIVILYAFFKMQKNPKVIPGKWILKERHRCDDFKVQKPCSIFDMIPFGKSLS